MNGLDLRIIVPLLATAFYTILLIISFVRRGRNETQQTLHAWFLAASVVWEFARLLLRDLIYPPRMDTAVLLLATFVLGLTTAVFADWKQRRAWYVIVAGSLALLLAGNIFVPGWAFVIPEINLFINYGVLAGVLGWMIPSLYLLQRVYRSYRQTQFPWHANRLLYWMIGLGFIFVGEVLLFPPDIYTDLTGQLLRFVGATLLSIAVASYRVLDVRTRAQRLIAYFIITGISIMPIAMAALVGQRLIASRSQLIRVSLRITAVAIGFLLYQIIRDPVERFVYRYLLGEDLNTNQVVRRYSQAIASTLDVQKLSYVIIGTLAELLGVNRGALLLITKLDDGYEIQPVPAMGNISREVRKRPLDNVFIELLQNQHQPLLQYEIDFNPDYGAISLLDRGWLREIGMELFAPIGIGSEMAGLIALGPKTSGVPYSTGELELVQLLADQTVVALDNARLYGALGGQNKQIQQLNDDLVEEKEQLQIMDRVKSDFITIASHELRTPLTQVKGYTDILSAMNEENALTREQTREIIGHVNRATVQLESLITAMLDASQLDAEGIRLTYVPTKLETVIKLAQEPLISAMRERQIKLHTDGLDTLPQIRADFKRLVQAFTNLLGNAVKYTPDHGSISISAMEMLDEAGESFVEIVIADSGIGIDPEYHKLIFEKFFRVGDPQLHSTGSTKFKGAGPGLGLPIAKGVIESHEGRIWVESEGEDEKLLPGSKFYIILPVVPEGAREEKDGKETAVRPPYLFG